MPARRSEAEPVPGNGPTHLRLPGLPGLQAAFFDVDGTCADTTVLHYYFWYLRDRLPRPRRWGPIGKLLVMIPYYWALDRHSRAAFNHAFYKNYAGISPTELEAWGRTALGHRLLSRVYPGAKREFDALRSHGVPIIFVTGSLPAVVQPLRRLAGAAVVLGTALKVKRGVFTGEIDGNALAGEEKVRGMQAFSKEGGIDLLRCAAYGDSMTDAPMLEAVGHPVAVNPSAHLRRHAQRNRWPICDWT